MWKNKLKMNSTDLDSIQRTEEDTGVFTVPSMTIKISPQSASRTGGFAVSQVAPEYTLINLLAKGSHLEIIKAVAMTSQMLDMTLQNFGCSSIPFQIQSVSRECPQENSTKEAGDTSPEAGAMNPDSSSRTLTSTEPKSSTGKSDTQTEATEDLASREDVVRRFMDLNKFQKWDVISLLLKDLEIPSFSEWLTYRQSHCHQQRAMPTLNEWRSMRESMERFFWRFLTEMMPVTSYLRLSVGPTLTPEPRSEKTSVTYINNKA